jgi:hypothetical protein
MITGTTNTRIGWGWSPVVDTDSHDRRNGHVIGKAQQPLMLPGQKGVKSSRWCWPAAASIQTRPPLQLLPRLGDNSLAEDETKQSEIACSNQLIEYTPPYWRVSRMKHKFNVSPAVAQVDG